MNQLITGFLTAAFAGPWLTLAPGASEVAPGLASNISFRVVPSTESGVAENPGLTFGGAWADFNGDGFPDLFLNNHARPDDFYLNNGDGTFRQAAQEVFPKDIGDYVLDSHGCAFADYDNDGDLDLVQLVGGGAGRGRDTRRQHVWFFVNEGGRLTDRSSELGISYFFCRGRGPLWLDFNKDGLLDLAVGVEPRSDDLVIPATVFEQKPDHAFEEASARTFRLLVAPNFLYSDLTRDGVMDLVVDNDRSISVYDPTTAPFSDVTAAVFGEKRRAGKDMVIADFDGDRQPDVYITQGAGSQVASTDYHQNTPYKATVRIANSKGKAEKGIQFACSGDLTVNIGSVAGRLNLDSVFIGAGGNHPQEGVFVLSPDSPDAIGVCPHKAGEDSGVYIGYDPKLNLWQMLVSRQEPVAIIEGSQPIAQLAGIGFLPDPAPPGDVLLINTPQGLVDKSGEAGINEVPIRGSGVVAGDFDNDMDVDLYIVTSRSVVNTPNILLENQGAGAFVVVPDAGGAAGTELGMGNFPITADYDVDGFLDLLVANGGRGAVDPIASQSGYQLFHNQGNGNHWLEIDLQGVRSNRDGIGARILLTAGGVTQLREQAGGVRRVVQDSPRLHFGLGTNAVVQELLIRWPFGTEQRIRNVAADQALRVVESDADGLGVNDSKEKAEE